MFDRGSGAAVRVRVRTTRDVCGARQRAAAAIGWADLHPPSLPPAAILCVRWLRVGEMIGAPHDLASRRRFEGALRSTLDQRARRAMRPADGPVEAGETVLFDDRAELLSCLARDWMDGRAGDRWWWRTMLRARVTLDLVVNTWIDAGPHIVPAFERLAAIGRADVFASTLDSRHVRALVAAMSRAHGGAAAADLAAGGSQAGRTEDVRRPIDVNRIATIAGEVTAIAARGAAAGAPLRRDQRALVVLASVIRQRPSLVWRPRFVDAFNHALDAMEPSAEIPPDVVPVAHAAPRRDREYGEMRPARPADTGDWPETRPPMPASPARQAIPDSPRSHDAAWPAGNREGDVAADPAATIETEAPIGPPSDGGPGLPQTSSSTRTSPVASSSAAPFTETPLGGMFYLLNVVIALRLYGDFTMPQRRGLSLSPWDLLALAAEHWLGGPLDASTAGLLARLAGRAPDERPGERFWTRDRVARWVPRLVRRINARVARGLGEPAGTNVAWRLLGHRARVYVTAAHVDVMFDLESLPIAIRLAGFDRDPGWIPASGRIVAFHYS
jgi:hypothetical protein